MMDLWDQEEQLLGRLSVHDARNIVMARLIQYGVQAQDMVRFSSLLFSYYGAHLGSLAMIVLANVYMNVKDRAHSIVGFFEQGVLPSAQELALCVLPGGARFINEVEMWSRDLSYYVFMLDAPTLLGSVVVESLGFYPIVLMDAQQKGGYFVHTQCRQVHQKLLNKRTWMFQGESCIEDLMLHMRERLIEVWEEAGLLYLLGARFLLDNISDQQPSVITLLRHESVCRHRLYADIEEAYITNTVVVDAMRRVLPNLGVCGPLMWAQKMMYFFVYYRSPSECVKKE